MRDAVEVAIIGGGVIGAAIAYFLTTDPVMAGKVTVLERDPTYAECSTTRSVGSIRQQFSTAENVRISRFGIDFLRRAPEILAVPGCEPPHLSLVEGGYLFLATAAGRPVLEANHRVQQAEGAPVDLLSPDALSARFPWLRVDDIALGSLGRCDEGWFDPYALLQAFRSRARHQGAVFRKAEVVGLSLDRTRVTGLNLDDGSALGCAVCVNAAGPRAHLAAAMAGVDVPVRPRRRCVFTFTCPDTLPGCPMIIDPSGFYVRPEGDRFLCGLPPAAADDHDTLDLDVAYDLFDERLWPLLADRIPAFERLRFAGAWAGHYAMNTVDANALIGWHPERPNLMLANGFSGHGIQQSPAVGRAVAELILHGRFTTLDLSRFAPDRAPVLEQAVI